MEETSPENFLDVRHERPNATFNRCGLFGCCRGSGNQIGSGCSTSCFPSNNHRIEPVIFAPTDDVYLDLKPGRRIRVIYKTGSNTIQTNASNGAVITNPLGQAISYGDSDEDEDYWFENVSPRRPAIQPVQQKKQAPKRIFHKFEPQERPKFDMKVTKPDSCASVGSSGGRLPRKTIKADAVLDDDDDEDDEDGTNSKKDKLSLNEISRKITFDQNPGAQEPATLRSSCLSTPRDYDEGDEDNLASSPSVSGGSQITTLHVGSAMENASELILNITADSTKANPENSQNIQRSISTSPNAPLPHNEMTVPDSDGKTVINIPDPGESTTDGPSPTPAINGDDVIEGDEEGTTTIIVSGGHLGGVANVGFEEEDEDEENAKPAKECVDGITIKNTNQIESNSSITSPSNVQTEIHDDGEGKSSSSTESSPSQAESEHSADAGYRRIRNLPEAISDAMNDQESSEEETVNSETEHEPTDPLRKEWKWYETPPAPKTNGGVQIDTKPKPNPLNAKPLLFFIHGVGGSANTWSTQLSYFSDSLGYECVSTDLLGHGFSSSPDKAKSYTFKKLLKDTFVVFDHFTATSSMNMMPSGCDLDSDLEPRSCVVIGHSYGCAIAASIAKQRPDNVKMLILLACGGPTPLTPPTGLNSLPPSFMSYCVKPFLKCGLFLQRQKEKAAGNINGNATNMSKTSAAASVAARRGKNEYFRNTLDIPSYVLHHVMMGQNWPEGDASFYRRIGLPSLLVYGLKDPVISLVEMCEMERTIPKSYLELIPLAGHDVMQDQPKSLNIMLRKFIEKYST